MRYPILTMTAVSLLSGITVSAHANNSNVESALRSDGDTSTFYQALLTTGVAGELNENTEYTVFAPTNAAFAEIQPSAYPCFYSVQCRAQVAAVLRNHIIPRNESLTVLSKWGDISTVGNREILVEEAYKGQYTADGHLVLNEPQNKGSGASIYRIDGVIATNRELAQFQVQPAIVGAVPGVVTEKTVTTYRVPAAYPVAQPYLVPGGGVPVVVPAGVPVYGSPIYVGPDALPDATTQTTTVTTHTTTMQ